MNRITLSAAVILAALVLAACNVVVEPPPPSPPANTIDVTASNDFSTPLEQFTLNAGSTQVFRVTVPSSVDANDLLYIELDREAPLEVMTGTYGTVTYSASSSEFFGTGSTGIVAATSSVSSQGIGTTVPCRGSCVILEDQPSEFYIRVGHVGGSVPSQISLYIYGDSYVDLSEPFNNELNTAPALEQIDAGAIETVGDVDYFWMPVTASVTFETAANGFPVEAYRLGSSGQVIAGPFGAGDVIGMNTGEFIRVWAVAPNEAAVSAKSQYSLDYQAF